MKVIKFCITSIRNTTKTNKHIKKERKKTPFTKGKGAGLTRLDRIIVGNDKPYIIKSTTNWKCNFQYVSSIYNKYCFDTFFKFPYADSQECQPQLLYTTGPFLIRIFYIHIYISCLDFF